jgi:hypothetical protein
MAHVLERRRRARPSIGQLGLTDVYFGLPDNGLSRAVPVVAGHPGTWINQLVLNRQRVRQAVIPTDAYGLADLRTIVLRCRQ